MDGLIQLQVTYGNQIHKLITIIIITIKTII